MLWRRKRIPQNIDRQPLIDSDLIVYECSAVGQYVDEETKEIVVRDWEFVEELFNEKVRDICVQVGATLPPILFLTGNKRVVGEDFIPNFREVIAVSKGYKDTRKEEKPYHYDNLRAYIASLSNTKIANGCEADDLLCIEQISVAKEYGVAIPTHAGPVLVDYEDWLKYSGVTFSLNVKGYVVNDTGKGETRDVWLLHRSIMNNPEGLVVDHINGDKMDNRKYNLRACSVKENVRNSKPQAGTSIYKGVSYDASRCKYTAGIKVDKVHKFLGRYDLEIDAAEAYDRTAKELFGEFARLNLQAPIIKPFKETIICSRDKDLRQCPLLHYGWEVGKQAEFGPHCYTALGNIELVRLKSGPKIVGGGFRFFASQLLTGDPVDNIGGLQGWGAVKSFNLLKELETERDLLRAVRDAYIEQHPKEWSTYLREQTDLLWMVRELNENGSLKFFDPRDYFKEA